MLKKEYSAILTVIMISLVVGIFIRLFCFSIYRIEGSSMNPTLTEGSLVFSLKMPLARLINYQIKTGDIIVFEVIKGKKLIKRAYGFPGDKLWVDNFQVFVNNKNITQEKKIKYSLGNRIDCKYSEIFEVAKDSIFVLGDNICFSQDSRYIGAISESSIQAIVLAQISLPI